MNFIGDKNALCLEFVRQGVGCKEDAEKIVEFLTEHRKFLSELESFEIKTEYPDMPPKMMGLMIVKNSY